MAELINTLLASRRVVLGTEDIPEMPFAKDHDVVEAFPPDRADETFAAAVLPG